jgi:hypothetical protein
MPANMVGAIVMSPIDAIEPQRLDDDDALCALDEAGAL